MLQSGEVGESGSCGGARVASCTQGASSSAHRSAHRTSPFQNVTKRNPARRHFCSVKHCPVSTLNYCFLDRNDIDDDDFHGIESLLHQISSAAQFETVGCSRVDEEEASKRLILDHDPARGASSPSPRPDVVPW